MKMGHSLLLGFLRHKYIFWLFKVGPESVTAEPSVSLIVLCLCHESAFGSTFTILSTYLVFEGIYYSKGFFFTMQLAQRVFLVAGHESQWYPQPDNRSTVLN